MAARRCLAAREPPRRPQLEPVVVLMVPAREVGRAAWELNLGEVKRASWSGARGSVRTEELPAPEGRQNARRPPINRRRRRTLRGRQPLRGGRDWFVLPGSETDCTLHAVYWRSGGVHANACWEAGSSDLEARSPSKTAQSASGAPAGYAGGDLSGFCAGICLVAARQRAAGVEKAGSALVSCSDQTWRGRFERPLCCGTTEHGQDPALKTQAWLSRPAVVQPSPFPELGPGSRLPW